MHRTDKHGETDVTEESLAEKKPDSVIEMIKEIQSSNRVILKRLNQVFLASDRRTLECACKDDVEECKDELEKMGPTLEHIGNTVSGFEERIKTAEQRLDTVEASLLAIQTDDSKLKRSSQKEEKCATKADIENESNNLPGINAGDTKTPDVQAALGAEGSTKDADSTTDVKSAEGEFIQNMNEKNKNLCSDGCTKDQLGVEVVEQTEVKCHDDEGYWRYLAQREMTEGRETLRDLEGVHSIICLDISASMTRGSAWTEANNFVTDYLKGLEEICTRYGMSDEHVALVTFGHETKVQKRLTNKYKILRDAIECLRLGGPSPLYGGMCLALAAAGSSDHHPHLMNFTPVFPKLIIITDGHLTDQRMFAGPDTPAMDADQAKAKVLESVEEYKSNHFDMFIVSVGQADKEFLGFMSAVGKGTVLDYTGGRQLSRRTYLTSKIQDPLGMLPSLDNDSSWSKEDKDMMDSIRSKSMRGIKVCSVKQDKYNEINDEDFPPIGSRVRRGPDWRYWNQDSHGPGTVIGHNKNLTVWVEWDTDGYRNTYRYGGTGYDVLIVDEPRILDKGQEIAVGCVVNPGKDLRSLRPNDKGVVIKLDKIEKKAMVRWSNGKRTDCSYEQHGKQEIVVCSGFQPFGCDGRVLGSATPSVERQHKNKNKQPNFLKQE